MSNSHIEKEVYEDVFGDPGLHTEKERTDNMQFVTAAIFIPQDDTLAALYESGPLDDGDVPSKSRRDGLILEGYCTKVVLEGVDGFNACTHRGARLYRCQKSIQKRPESL